MKTKIVTGLLAVSVCFNVFFAIGFMRARNTVRMVKTAEGRGIVFAKSLDLSEEQKKKYMVLQNRLHTKLNRIKQKYSREQNSLIRDIAGGSADISKVNRFLEFSRHDVQQLRIHLATHTVEVMKILTPEQRKKVIKILKNKRSVLQFII